MRAGKLRHRGTLLVPVADPAVPDAIGDTPAGFTRGDEVMFGLEPLTPRELFYAAQVRPDVTHKVTLRYRDDVTASYALEWNTGTKTRVFQFGPPLSTEERQIDMVITAVERK